MTSKDWDDSGVRFVAALIQSAADEHAAPSAPVLVVLNAGGDEALALPPVPPDRTAWHRILDSTTPNGQPSHPEVGHVVQVPGASVQLFEGV